MDSDHLFQIQKPVTLREFTAGTLAQREKKRVGERFHNGPLFTTKHTHTHAYMRASCIVCVRQSVLHNRDRHAKRDPHVGNPTAWRHLQREQQVLCSMSTFCRWTFYTTLTAAVTCQLGLHMFI